jgi:hypothetical protein
MSKYIDSLQLLNTMTISSIDESTSTITGAVTVAGGCAASKNMSCKSVSYNGRLSGKVRTTAVSTNLTDDYIVNVTAVATLTLPDITDVSYDAVTYNITKDSGVFTVTIDTQAVDKILYGGSLLNSITLTVTGGEHISIISDGTNWHATQSISASVPNAPTAIVATAGTGSASIAFTAPTDNGGAEILYYTVTSSLSGYTNIGTSTPIIISGLDALAYTFTMRAVNEAGLGTLSSASNSVTPS